MSKPKIYLCGAMTSGKLGTLSFEEMNQWRTEAIKLFKEHSQYRVHIINPCDFYNTLISPDSYTDREVKEYDLQLVKMSDIILINLNFPDSIGSAIEVHMAHDEWKKPVIGFGKEKNHPWIELSLTKRCNTLEDAIYHINDFYLLNY